MSSLKPDKKTETVIQLLKISQRDLSITDLENKTKFPRSSIRTILAKLEGAQRVTWRQVGMAKLYHLIKK